jgi:hypothetical protein
VDCTKQFNERSSGLLNRTQYPSAVIALVVLWRLRYKLSLRDLAEMFLVRGFVFTYEAVRDWEAKLTTALAEELRRLGWRGLDPPRRGNGAPLGSVPGLSVNRGAGWRRRSARRRCCSPLP